ncbi:MAG: hypothetical protein E7271_07355 [Lachnospiraceae bacterium]|jgi:transglutaminase-like putative cysteine protease|nr:hypothetical protein [Lachnospiraceae bacterium]
MGLFRRKKKEDVHKDDFMMTKGMYLGKADIKNGHIILNCFLRALIVFFLVLGMIGGFLSAFDITCNYLIVITVFLLLSMYFSFLYATTRFFYRDLGYILFFGLFIVAIYVFRIYANSGFYYVVNKVLDTAKTFFDLPGVREYEVQIGNNNLTVAIAACFIGMVMIIVLNIWMYSIMSVFWTILFTFPIMVIPMYMKMSPDPVYMVFLAIGYFCVFIFRANGHYVLFAWDNKFKVRGLRKKRVTYTQDAGVFGQLIISLFALFLVTIFVTNAIVLPTAFERRFKSDRLRSTTSDAIGNFLLLGFSSFFNKYPSTAGMSGGKLGGVSNVRPDYLTDLEATFVPYGNDAIYLRGFVGGEYGENEWLDAFGYENEPDFESEFNKYTLGSEKDTLKNNKGKYYAQGYMEIRNIGASPEYLYYPYYTEFDDEFIKSFDSEDVEFRNGLTRKYKYYPKVVWEEELGSLTPDKIDKSGILDMYLEVPDKNKEVIDEICNEIGVDDSMTEYEIVDKVRDFFAENYPYTLKPGMTPDGSDFVNYFLTKNKKGYCAHFASSSVLIFRELGIPARYVEGYAFSMEEVFTSDEAEGLEASDYYTGYSALGDAPVMNVEVSDANAHAWVEIYVDGFGWKPVEMTPGSNEETEENDFWSAFGDFMGGGLGDNDGGVGLNGLNLSLSSLSGIVFVIIGIVLVAILIYIVRIIIRKIKRYMLMHQDNKRDALIARYSYVCDLLRICNADFDTYRTHKDQLTFMKDTYGVDMDVDKVTTIIESMSFHDEMPDEKVFEEMSKLTIVLRKAIKKKSGLKNRLKMIQK